MNLHTARGLRRALHAADAPLVIGILGALTVSHDQLHPDLDTVITYGVSLALTVSLWFCLVRTPLIRFIESVVLQRMPLAEWLDYFGLTDSWTSKPPTASEYSIARGWVWRPIDFEIHQNLALARTAKETDR